MATRAPPSIDRAGVAIAVALLLVAGLIAWDASRLRLGSVYGVGPAAAPLLVAGGMAALAIGNLVLAIRGDQPAREALDGAAILLILGGLAGLILVIGIGGGFVLATAILFAATATAMGRRAAATDLAIGLVLGLLVYLLFAKLLALSLPAGPLEAML